MLINLNAKLSLMLKLASIGSLLTSASCASSRFTKKTELSEGYYFTKKDDGFKQVYVKIEEHAIKLLDIQKCAEDKHDDTIFTFVFDDPASTQRTIALHSPTIDVDLLYLPVKLRPAAGEVPNQLSNSINANVYLGLRNDWYIIGKPDKITGILDRDGRHYGLSAGIFSGFGNTHITPSFTNNLSDLEYEGIVWTNGIAAIIAIDRYTAGAALGIDFLTDKNKSAWIYHRKPFIALVIGLNLN